LSVDSAARAASLGAFMMIAVQVCGKAARDAMFLSTHGIDALPAINAVSALVSLLSVLVASRWVTRYGPSRVATVACAAGGLVFAALWLLARSWPAAAAIALYVHVSSGGALLISWFWSIVNERFDPRSARRRMGWIAGGGAAGGVAGGVLAERFASSSFDVLWLLPVLAILQGACAALVVVLDRRSPVSASTFGKGSVESPPQREAWTAGLATLRRNRHLANLAACVLVTTLAAALIDFIFKTQATTRLAGSTDLLRFFAMFYAVAGLTTLALQWTASTWFLERLGVARTAALLPGAVSLGGIALLVPGSGFAAATVVRGAEATLRSSVFRSSYELLYTPVPPREKRATKAAIDVGVERVGDAAGAGIIQLVLWMSTHGRSTLVPQAALAVIAGMAALLGLIGVSISSRLGRGYVASLEQSLFRHGTPTDVAVSTDVSTRSVVFETMGRTLLRGMSRAATPFVGDVGASGIGVSTTVPLDPIDAALADLGSGDATRVRARLTRIPEPIDRRLVPHLVRLLAWDEVAPEVARTLRPHADELVGDLSALLTDPTEEFAVRRRIPRVLSSGTSEAVIRSLIEGLNDIRFEVRYQCAAAIARMRDRDPAVCPDRDLILDIVCREAAVDRRVWESHRLLDGVEAGDGGSMIDAVLRTRTSRALEHVFNLLSLIHPKEPLRIAFQALHTDDARLRGTALEYLESALPARVRAPLWPLLEDPGTTPRTRRSQEEVLESLLESHASIQQNLEALRRRGGTT
jgi:ATP/ADP translocase